MKGHFFIAKDLSEFLHLIITFKKIFKLDLDFTINDVFNKG